MKQCFMRIALMSILAIQMHVYGHDNNPFTSCINYFASHPKVATATILGSSVLMAGSFLLPRAMIYTIYPDAAELMTKRRAELNDPKKEKQYDMATRIYYAGPGVVQAVSMVTMGTAFAGLTIFTMKNK
ncbi:MAG: hypothetical protein WCE21_05860 [Candidatus Babeliales bacterium]